MIQASANRLGILALFRNAGADAIAGRTASLYAGGAQVSQSMVFDFEDVPGVTTAQTYSVRIGPSGDTMYLNGTSTARLLGGVQASTLILEEIAQ